MSSQAPPLPAPDLFAYRRARAGIPDAPLGAALTPCGLYVSPSIAAEFGPLPVICGLPECKPCGRASAAYWFGDVPPPRPMRPALDGEAP